MMNILHDDAAAITSRTKLELVDIKQLIELCLSKCYFLYENSIFTIDDAGHIGLSLMVVMAEAYLQHLEKTALNIAEVDEMVPITFKRYVDDSHSRFGKLEQAEGFPDILNAQDPKIQYTIEIEDCEKSLSFLDVKICNNGSGSYDCQVHRKDAITNVQIKPHSSINPSILDSVFKGFLVRAHRLCSPKHLEDEIAFLIDVFVENGHTRSNLLNMANSYIIPEKKNSFFDSILFQGLVAYCSCIFYDRLKKGYMFILENFRIIIETITCIFMCFLYSVTLFATISMIFIAIEDKDKEIEVLKIMALISFIDYIH